jgi:hypothetical protein
VFSRKGSLKGNREERAGAIERIGRRQVKVLYGRAAAGPLVETIGWHGILRLRKIGDFRVLGNLAGREAHFSTRDIIP